MGEKTKQKDYIAKWTFPDALSDNGYKLVKAEISGTCREHAMSKLMCHSIYQLYLHAAFPKELDNFTLTHEFLMWIEL